MASRPVKKPYREGAGFGDRVFYGIHKGKDYLPAKPGGKDPVYSPVSGKVLGFIGGKCHGIDIKAKNGDIHRLCHLNPLVVSRGIIKQGQYIGNMSLKGLSLSRHTHWAVIRNGITINPLSTLTNDLNELRKSINSLFRVIYHRNPIKDDNDYYLSRIGQQKPFGINTVDDLIEKMKYWSGRTTTEWLKERRKVLNK